jgi:hypothetical protein
MTNTRKVEILLIFLVLVLKLTNQIDCSWWWLISPICIELVPFLLGLLYTSFMILLLVIYITLKYIFIFKKLPLKSNILTVEENRDRKIIEILK